MVPALVQAHPFHPRAFVWLQAAYAGTIEGIVTWHGIAETWSVLTRLPLSPPISARLAESLLETLRTKFAVLSVSAKAYKDAIRRASEKSVRSGALFDALHLVTAEQAKASVLVTFNQGDFERLSKLGGPRIIVPPDPPHVTTG